MVTGTKYIYQATTINCSLWVAKNYLFGNIPENWHTKKKVSQVEG